MRKDKLSFCLSQYLIELTIFRHTWKSRNINEKEKKDHVMYGQSESVTSAIFFFCIGPSLLLSFRVTRYETLILLSATLSKFFLTRPCTASNAFATWISIIGNSLAYCATNFRVLMKHRKNFFFFWLLLVPFFTRTNLKKEIIIT